MSPTLFPLEDYLPPHQVSRKRGPAVGTRPVNANWDEATKVVRIPISWDTETLKERFECIHSALYTAEEELKEAKARGNGKLSNRFQKLARLVKELRSYMPKRDTYDPFR